VKNKKKDFDCVDMKNKVQEKITEDKKKYPSEKEYQKARLRELLNDPKWSNFLKSVNRTISDD
jgi:hypothetical protein